MDNVHNIYDIANRYNNKKYSIDIFTICKVMDIKIMTLKEAKKVFKIGNKNIKAITLKYNEVMIIIYKDTLNERWQRFLIAHELGHIVLEHSKKDKKYIEQEQEANLFAQILLGVFDLMEKGKTKKQISVECIVPLKYSAIDDEIYKEIKTLRKIKI